MNLNRFKLDQFFKPGRFSTPATVYPQTPHAVPYEVGGIYDAAPALDADGLAPVRINQPMVTCDTATVSRVAIGDGIAVQGEGRFVITDIAHDGTGTTQLHLERD